MNPATTGPLPNKGRRGVGFETGLHFVGSGLVPDQGVWVWKVIDINIVINLRACDPCSKLAWEYHRNGKARS